MSIIPLYRVGVLHSSKTPGWDMVRKREMDAYLKAAKLKSEADIDRSKYKTGLLLGMFLYKFKCYSTAKDEENDAFVRQGHVVYEIVDKVHKFKKPKQHRGQTQVHYPKHGTWHTICNENKQLERQIKKWQVCTNSYRIHIS